MHNIRHNLPVKLGSSLPGFSGKLCLWNQSYNLPVNVGKCPKWLVNYDCDFRVVIYQWNRANVDLVTLKVQSWLVNFVTEFNVIIYQLKSAKELSLKISWIFDCLWTLVNSCKNHNLSQFTSQLGQKMPLSNPENLDLLVNFAFDL